MSKQGRARRTPEQRITRKLGRAAAGKGIFRYLTPEQAASPEFAPENIENIKPSKSREQNRAERRGKKQ